MDAWSEIAGKVLEDANTPGSSSSGRQKQNLRLKPSARHKAAISRLSLRFPGTTMDRISLLAEDTADIPADMIEDVCDRAARECRFFPTASELRERAASTLKEQPESAREQNTRVMLHSINTKLMVEGSPYRWIAPNGNWQMVDVVSKYGALPKYRCNGAGGVEEAWFDRKTREWRWPDGETIHLPAKPISRDETDRLNAECARMGIKERFNYDGTTYQA